jgi:hypothetical protein
MGADATLGGRSFFRGCSAVHAQAIINATQSNLDIRARLPRALELTTPARGELSESDRSQ